jgi:hypothetical protein
MGKRISVVFLISLFALFLFAGGALGATDAKKVHRFVPVPLPVDGAQPPGEYAGFSPVFYELGRQPDCEDINPVDPIVIIQHEQWGATFYDYQKNGSMGRMIAASPAGCRHMVFHETRGPYGNPPEGFPRQVTYNCKDSLSDWCGPAQVDEGPGHNSGYAQMLLLHDGTEVVLYHKAGPAIPGPWHTSLLRGEYGYECQCFITDRFDIPDCHDNPIAAEPNGYWPKGATMYDGITDSDYVHVVTTENNELLGGTQSIAYQRCVFEPSTQDIVCYSPHDPVYGPYRRSPNVDGDADDLIAVLDTIKCIVAVVVSSPVSKRVAIVYTKHREDAQVNCDVVYVESMNNGEDWFAPGGWPPTIHNVTNYPGNASGPRAYTDVAACYDYNDSLHIVWNAHYYDTLAGTVTYRADLYHWSKGDPEISMIAAGPEPEVGHEIYPGGWNRTICKPSISAKDPIYHEGGDPDSVFLFVTWTQFNKDDLSLGGMTNGDIYAAASNNAGKLWTLGYNLTNTQTPDCAAGECLSEHWSSLAEYMYDGDLHIEYVCDRDAGGIVQDEGTWCDNPMMYMHVEQFEVKDACGAAYEFIDPPSWCTPPLKVLPGVPRTIKLQLTGLYNMEGGYQVTTNHGKVTCVNNCDGTLDPGEKIEVGLNIDCAGQEEFINATISIHVCIGSVFDTTYEVTLHAVCSDEDYYECPVDPRTWILKDNCKCSLWVCCNTEQMVWDKRLRDEDGGAIQPIFSGGSAVGTTWEGDTVVGRQDYRDTRTGAKDTLQHWMYPDYFQPECLVQKIHCKNTYIWANHLLPPNCFRWWWIDIHKQIIIYHDNPEVGECPNWKKEQIIKYMWITKSQPPAWWPGAGVGEQAYEKIKFGYFADVDAPFIPDSNGYNDAGYTDTPDYIMWQSGYDTTSGSSVYLDYYVGLALTERDGTPVEPWGAHNVVNEQYLYPNEGWGWKDGELYRLMDIPGVDIDSAGLWKDRTWVITPYEPIPAGTEPFDQEFILIEAFIPGGPGTGLAELQMHIDDTRAELIPHLDFQCAFERKFPPRVPLICGDANDDGIVNIADVVYLVTYQFLDGPPPYFGWPFCPGDANGDGVVNIADVVYLVTYQFLDGPPPTDCEPICP